MTSTVSPDVAVSGQYRSLFADILSQAVTGELVGMGNYAAMVHLHPTAAGQLDALGYADVEASHVHTFQQAARDLGVSIRVDPRARYWARIRRAFMERVQAGDLDACLIIQDVILKSFAVSTYRAVAAAAQGDLRRAIQAVLAEELQHLDRSLPALRESAAADPRRFESKLALLQQSVVSVLGEMTADEDPNGPCDLCQGECMKSALRAAGLGAAELRRAAIGEYVKTLVDIGVRPEFVSGLVAA